MVRDNESLVELFQYRIKENKIPYSQIIPMSDITFGNKPYSQSLTFSTLSYDTINDVFAVYILLARNNLKENYYDIDKKIMVWSLVLRYCNHLEKGNIISEVRRSYKMRAIVHNLIYKFVENRIIRDNRHLYLIKSLLEKYPVGPSDLSKIILIDFASSYDLLQSLYWGGTCNKEVTDILEVLDYENLVVKK